MSCYLECSHLQPNETVKVAFFERVFEMAAFSDFSSTFPLNPFRVIATFNQRVFWGFTHHLRSEVIQFFGNLSNPYVNTV